MNRPDYEPEIAEQDEYGNTTVKNQNPDDAKTVLSADERLDIALSLFTEQQVEEFADTCAKQENSQ